MASQLVDRAQGRIVMQNTNLYIWVKGAHMAIADHTGDNLVFDIEARYSIHVSKTTGEVVKAYDRSVVSDNKEVDPNTVRIPGKFIYVEIIQEDGSSVIREISF